VTSRLSIEDKIERRQRRTIQRFEESYIPEPMSGCYLWLGSSNNEGRARFANPEVGGWENAARFSWRLVNGPIPNDAMILHRCDNPLCVSPDHLYPGDAKQNSVDRENRNRFWKDRVEFMRTIQKIAQPRYGDEHAKATKNRKWINNGHINHMLASGGELPSGWVYGRLTFRRRKKITEKNITQEEIERRERNAQRRARLGK
jgi:hypothetical protein